jgi:osmotically-inducible protein OsmY
MRRNDAELQRDVVAELRWTPSIRDEEIAVAVKDGVVTLAGTVDRYAQKLAAEKAAERVSGVRAVAEALEVKPVGALARSDTELAHAAADALRWNVEVPLDRVKAKVEDGWITLHGDVEWRFQRDAAERAVRYLIGARGVINLVALRPRVSSYDVSQRIKEALRRRAELDASKIHVETMDGTVRLTGSVHTWAERADAESAAWAAPGVSKVEDNLVLI